MATLGSRDSTTGLTRIGADDGLNYAPVLIANTWLPRLMDKLQFIMLLTGAQENGRAEMFNRKIGDRFFVRRPFRAKTYEQRVIADADIRKTIERLIEVRLDTWAGYALTYNVEQVTLAIKDRDKRQFIDPGIEEIAYRYDYRASSELSVNTHLLNGTPGSAITIDGVRKLGAHMTHMSVDPGECHLMLDPLDCAGIDGDIQSLDAPALVTRVVQNKYKGRLARFMTHEANTIPTITVPSQQNIALAVASTSVLKGSTIKVSATGSRATALRKILNAGNIIQLPNVHEVRLRGERLGTGRLKTFTVLEDVSLSATPANAVDVKISPEINNGTLAVTLGDGTTSYVLKDYETVDDLPVSGAVVKVVGANTSSATDTVYRQALAFRPDTGEVFVSDLEEQSRNFTFSRRVRDMILGTRLSMLFTESGDFKTLEALMRIDSLFTVKQTYPDVAGRIWTEDQ